ncbi:MAG: PKD domain-containing protein [Bacteroidota bacterium]
MNYPFGSYLFFTEKLKLTVARFLPLVGILLLPFGGFASHIVGGELSYRCLGNFNYEIKLTVYRDCGGISTIPFDPTVSIGIFDGNNNLVTSLGNGGQLIVPQSVEDTLALALSDPCLAAPNNICVHSMTYVDTLALPPIAGGYHLVHQRCCRNSTISNIIGSFDTGASFVASISEAALLTCNSSPEFNAQPPLFICVNEPFAVDQSVFDQDGDSLVYKLCIPLDGGSFSDPAPQPPSPPPYEEVILQNPPYSLNNLLGGVPLTIDPQSGIVTGIPNTIGLFLVGMCVEEYRNGVLISETRREFQYNVGICEPIEASFTAPLEQCENLEVAFTNTSLNVDELLWQFNDPANPGATSTEINPTYTFSDTGTYEVTLTANPNGACPDTTSLIIQLSESTLIPSFDYSTLGCTDSAQILLVDTSTDPNNDIVAWYWELSDGQVSDEQFPMFTVDSAQQLIVLLNVFSSNGCTEQVQQTILINLIPSNILPEEIIICAGDTTQLVPAISQAFPLTYEWSPSVGLSDTDVASPFAFPEDTTTYILKITDTTNGCVTEIATQVSVVENIQLEVALGANGCGGAIELIATTNISQGQLLWSDNNEFTNILSDSASLIVGAATEDTFYVQFSNGGACAATDSITIQDQSVNVALDNNQVVCLGDTAQFVATNLDANDDLFYTWFSTVGSVLSTEAVLEIIPTQVGETLIYFQGENQFGCTYLDSVFLTVIDGNITPEIQITQDCNNTVAFLDNPSPNAAYYQWIIELPSGNDTLTGTSVLYEFPTTGIYNVLLVPTEGLPCSLPTEIFEVNIGSGIVTADFDWTYVDCENDLSVQFEDQSTALQGNVISWTWTFGNLPPVVEQNPILELGTAQSVDIQLVVLTNQGCVDTLNETIAFAPTDIGTFAEQVTICDGNSVTLNPLGNPDLNYEWSPASFLDDPTSPTPEASPPVTTTFAVIITDSTGKCVIEKTVEVIVPDEPVLAAYEYTIVSCNNDEVELAFLDTSTPTAQINNWFWQFSNGTTSNDPNVIVEAIAGSDLIVQLQVQTVEGCTAFLTDTIVVATFEFELPQSEIIKCSGVPVNLNPNANPNYTYEWSPSTALNDEEAPNPIANPVQTTEYCVTVTNGDCSDVSCVTVIVPDIPLTADFSFEVSGCIDEATIQLEDESQYSFNNITEWNWTFSNGSTSDLQNPTLTVTANTTLVATLEVVTSDGCEAQTTQEIVVNLIETDIPSQLILCDGSPVQLNLNGNPDHDYQWSPSSGLTDDDVPSPVVFPLSTTTYTVVVSDGDCAIIQAIQVVVPDQPLVPDFSFAIDDCTDIAVIDFTDESLYAPGNIVAWNWTFSNGEMSDLPNPSITLDASQALVVTLEVETSDGCVDIVTQTIDVSLIDINIPTSVVNCGMNGVELNVGGNTSYTYEWSPTAGLSDATAPNPIANPTTTTTYSVTVSDGPCELTRTVEVIVPTAALAADFTYTFDDCTDNAVIEFTDQTSMPNNTIESWQWTFTGNNTFVSDLQDPIIILNQSDTILAELVVTTTDGCTAVYSEMVEVNLIDINISGSVIYCNNGGVVLNPSGNPNYTYEWAPSAGLSGTDVASPTVTGLMQTTNYFVTVTFGNCILTRQVEILVPDIPLTADFDFEYLTCIDSATIQFLDASVFSGNIIEWDWWVNGQTSQAQDPIFVFEDSQPVDAQLIINTAHGCQDTINTAFDISVMTDVNIPTELATCNGNGVFLNPNSNPSYAYEWTPETGLNGNVSAANPFATPDSSTIYTVTISNNSTGCVEERTVSLNVPTQPLMAGFEWELTNCADSAVLVFSDTSSYSGNINDWTWNVENGDSDDTQNPTFTFPASDTLDVQLIVTSTDGCIDSITNEVIFDIIEIDFLEDSITLCSLGSVFLNPNGNPDLFYTWSPSSNLDSANVYNPLASPTTSTEYTVTITSPNDVACNEVRTVEILLPDQPLELNWNYPNDTIICDPSIELVAQSDNAVNFIWSDQANFQNILSDSSVVIAEPNNVATFYLQATDSIGCSLTDSIEVASYVILADVDEETTICFGDSVELEVVLNPLSVGVELEYTWLPQDGIIMGNNTSTPLLNPMETTTYELLIENQFGCTLEDSVQVNVVDLALEVELTLDRDSVNTGDLVQISTTENPDWTYTWTPCESLVSCDVHNPIVTAEATTTYTVEIFDEVNGCTYQDSISIFVFDESLCREPYVFVPKGFTPNEDNLNDILYVRGRYIEEVHFVIFNRWGEKVFETKDLNVGWDGKIDGKYVNPDVFGYYVSVKCFGGEEYLMKGNVTVIR